MESVNFEQSEEFNAYRDYLEINSLLKDQKHCLRKSTSESARSDVDDLNTSFEQDYLSAQRETLVEVTRDFCLKNEIELKLADDVDFSRNSTDKEYSSETIF